MEQQKKIIIQAFGLQAVETGVYAGVINGIVGATKLQSYAKTNNNEYDGALPQKAVADPTIGTSQLGTPIWDNLVIKAGSYIDTVYGPVNYEELRLDSILITIYQAHNVIITPIQGRDGEVIEYIGKMSFRINIKGGVFGTGNVRPVSDIANLKLTLQSNKSLIVKNCGFLSEWDISEFAILDKHLPQIAGGYNYQLFEINAIQDTPVILAQQQGNA